MCFLELKQKIWAGISAIMLLINAGYGQIADLPPLVKVDTQALIAHTDSLRFSLFPEIYHAKYMLLTAQENQGWPPIPFMPDVFDQLVFFPDSGQLNLQYGKFQVHSIAFYDYGGVHFNQINLATYPADSSAAVIEATTYLPEESLVTITFANCFGRAWIRFDDEKESDEWLEAFVEQQMQAFGPEVSEIREGSSGAVWLTMYTELLKEVTTVQLQQKNQK